MPTGINLVRYPGIQANTQLDFSPLERALKGHLDAGFRQAQLERDEDRLGLERDRFGLERERVDILRQTRADTAARQTRADKEARDESARTYVHRMLASEDPDAPDFPQRWAGHLTRLRAAGHPVGAEYDDPRTGYQQALAEALGPRGVIEQRERARAGQPTQTDPNRYVRNEQGDLEVAEPPPSEPTVGGGRFGLTSPAAFRPGDLQQPPDVSGPAQQTQVPGIQVQHAPQGRETGPARNERLIQELGPTVRGEGGRRPATEEEIQRYYRALYGNPGAGNRYGRNGEVIQPPPRQGADNTRGAVRGALDSAASNISDAREVLRGTNMVQRGLSYMTDVGVAARVQGPVRIAIRGILHGISGAQINIPEQQEYMNAMLPGTGDRISTIEFKLNHLENILTHIQRVQGAATDEQVLAVRNAMRRTLSLPALTLEQAGRRLDERTRPPPAQNQGGDGWSIRRID